MRTFILICVVALVVAGGLAYAIGLVEVDADHPDGKYVVTLTVNTLMLHHGASALADKDAPVADSRDITGKIAAVYPDKKEIVVSSDKNWTFALVKDGKVFINDRESNFAELQAGDDVVVTPDRYRPQSLASVIRSTRK